TKYGWEVSRVTPDGARHPIAFQLQQHRGGVIPSPTGERIAFVDIVSDNEHADGSSGPCTSETKSTATVSFFDAAGNAVGTAHSAAFVGGCPDQTWTPANQLIVSNG